VKEGTFERGAPTEAPEETKKQLMPNGLTEDRELEAPTAAHRAQGLMSIPEEAVTQKDRCHLVGHLRIPRAR